jgi:hypothetical protein
MMRRALAVAAVALLIGPPDLRAQAPKPDPDVAAGIRQVEEGDFDAAILTLDNAARRLAADPTRVRDLSQAYLYLGIAYVGKGHEAAAKAKFREAVTRIKDLSLSPDKFPPKVIDLFEAARDEASHAAAVPAVAAKPSPAPPPASVKKGGGSGKTVLLVGLGGAALAGVAVAAKGSGSSSPTGNTPNNNTPANDTRTLDTFTGSLPNGEQRGFRVVVQGPGLLEAQVSWPDPQAECGITLQEADPPYTTVANSRVTSNTSAQLVANVTAKVYLVVVGNYSGRAVVNFTLNVKHP